MSNTLFTSQNSVCRVFCVHRTPMYIKREIKMYERIREMYQGKRKSNIYAQHNVCILYMYNRATNFPKKHEL